MRMKYIAILAVVALLFAGGCSAQVENETDDKDLESFETPYGAKMRMLQLQASINHNNQVGQALLGQVPEGVDTAELESYLARLGAISDQIEGYGYEGQGDELAADFVALKKEAKELTKQYREGLKEAVGSQETARLRSLVRNGSLGQFKKESDAIAQARNMHNAQVMERVMKSMGVDDTELVDKMKNDQMKKGEAMKALKGKWSELDDEDKTLARQNVREHLAKQRVKQEQVKEKVQARWQERAENFAEKRAGQAEKWAEKAGNFAEKKGNQTGKWAERAENLSERNGKIAEKRAEMAGKMVEKKGEQAEKWEERSEKMSERQEKWQNRVGGSDDTDDDLDDDDTDDDEEDDDSDEDESLESHGNGLGGKK